MTARPLASRSALTAAAVALAFLASGCVESGRQSTTPSEAQGCPFEADESVDTVARIAYQNIPNGDLVVKDQGILEACMPNAKITWSRFDSGGDVIQAFGSGSVDLGLIGSSPATRALSAPLNIDMKVVWVHDVIGAAESLVARDPAITDITGLRGKRVAVPFSSTAHYSLLQALQDAGMNAASDLQIINLSPENMPAAWQGGEIDAAWVWAPTLNELQTAGGKIILTSADTAEAGKPTYDLGAGTSAFIDANQDFMTVWARAQNHAVKMIQSDPSEAAVSVAATLGIPPADVESQFEGYVYVDAPTQAGPDYLGAKMAQDLAATAQFLLEQGGIDAVSAPAVYEQGVDAAPAESAAS